MNRKILGAAVAIGLAALVVMGLFVSPPDAIQSDAVRLLYLHAPTAWGGYLAFGVTSIASLCYLIPRTRSARFDALAGASAEVGVLFIGLTLALGSLWGKPIWGDWWSWDARVTTTAILLFLYIGYLALRRSDDNPLVHARRNAVVAIIAFVDVPIVHFSVEWWRTQHQEGSTFNREMKSAIQDSTMQVTVLLGVLVFTLLYLYLVSMRMQVMRLEQQQLGSDLDEAIAKRTGAES